MPKKKKTDEEEIKQLMDLIDKVDKKKMKPRKRLQIKIGIFYSNDKLMNLFLSFAIDDTNTIAALGLLQINQVNVIDLLFLVYYFVFTDLILRIITVRNFKILIVSSAGTIFGFYNLIIWGAINEFFPLVFGFKSLDQLLFFILIFGIIKFIIGTYVRNFFMKREFAKYFRKLGGKNGNS